MRSRLLTIAIGPVAVLTSTGVAVAAWASTGAGSARAASTTLGEATNGSASAATEGSLVLSWSAPADGATPTGYVVRRDGQEISSCRRVTLTSCEDTGLTAATTYEYTVTPALGSWRGTASPAFRGRTTNAVAALEVASTSLPNATQGSGYSQSLEARGGTAPYYWSLVSGALPVGLTLSSAGTISGTPSATGTSSFTVRVTDSRTPAVSAERTLSLSVVSATAAPTVSTSTLPGTTRTASYSQGLTASGGVAPLTWALQAGTSLPAGLTLASSGTISGTVAATADTSSFTVVVTDSLGRSDAKSLTVTVAPVPSVTTTNLPAVGRGASYSQTLTATGGAGTLTWTASALPQGLSLSSTGSLAGTVTAGVGSHSFTVSVTDANAVVGTRSLTLVVNAAPAITGLTPNSFRKGTTTTVSISGSGFQSGAVVTSTISSGSTATIRLIVGTPTVSSSTITLSITADSANGVTGAHTIVVTNPDGGSASAGLTITTN